MSYWEDNRPVFRVVELATEEGDLRFQGLRVRALNAVTVTLAHVVAETARANPSMGASPAGSDPMAVAATLISMLAHVAAHRYGFEFWGIRTKAMIDSQARILHWTITGRAAPADAPAAGQVVRLTSARRTDRADDRGRRCRRSWSRDLAS